MVSGSSSGSCSPDSSTRHAPSANSPDSWAAARRRDAGLADAAGAGDGDQPGAAQQAAELGQLPLPSDEPGDLEGQLTGPLPG